MANHKKADFGAWLSITAYVCLSALKLSVGYYAESEALQADGLNNFTDILASVAVLIGLKISRKPRDIDHPYGHSRAENISSLIASFIMAVIGLQVLYQAIHSMFIREMQTPNMIAAWAGIFSALVMFSVYFYNKKLAKQTNSHALKAASKDNLSDALISVGAVIGIVGAQFALVWLDPLAAVVVGVFICKTAWDIFSEAAHMLTDGFDERKLEKYYHTIKEINGVTRVVDLRARMNGNEIFLDVTIKVDSDLSVSKSHDITDQIEERMKNEHNIRSTHIHVEPDVTT